MPTRKFDPDDILKAMTKELVVATNEVAIALISGLAKGSTPVLTGHANRNWVVSIGLPLGVELPGVDKTGSFVVAEATSKLNATIGRNAFLPVYVEDNVPYIQLLNAGYSAKAPAGFVEREIDRAIASADQRLSVRLL